MIKKIERINYLLFAISISLLCTFSSFKEYKPSEEKHVYICTNPNYKCYFVFPCKKSSEICSNINGKLYKVTLSRAKSLGKEKCDCKDQ